MRLLNLHIDNFGKLHDYDLTFEDGLTSICAENGKGKTTIAAFITVMLFGMSKNLKEQKDREHFYPFAGGFYGGRLSFSQNGDTYLVKRQFDKKSKAKDTVTITKNGQPIRLPDDKEIGELMYGIDESAFRRVCFINDNGLDFSEESIAGKLGGLAGDFDADEVEDSLERVLAAIKEIKPLRGNTGSLGDAEKTLAETENQIAELEALSDPLSNAQRAYHEAIKERLIVREQIESIREIGVNEERRKTAQLLLDTLNQKKDARDALRKKYPKGFPTDEEVEGIRSALRTVQNPKQISQGLTEEEKSRFDALSARFNGGFPSQEEIANINDKIKNLEELRNALTSQSKPSAAEEDIVRRFANNRLSEEEIQQIEEKLRDYRRACLDYENTDSTILKGIRKTETQQKSKGLSIGLLALGGAMLIGGIVTCFFLLWLGIVLAVIGLGAVALGVFLLAKEPKTITTQEEDRVVNPVKQQIGDQKDELRRQISIWLSRFYINDPDPISGMAKFSSEYQIYQSHVRGQEALKEGKEKAATEIASLSDGIDSFFRQYGYPVTDHRSSLLTLQKDIVDFQGLSSRYKSLQEAETKQKEILQSAEEKIRVFLAKFGIDYPNLSSWLSEAEKDKHALSHAEEEIVNAQISYDSFVKDNPVHDLPAPTLSLEGLQERENELSQIIADRRTSIDNWENQLEALEGLQNEKEKQRERIKALKRRHKILSAVKESIENAQNTIKEKYVGPIKKEFDRYAEMIHDTSGLTVDLDSNLELTYLASGEYRKSLHLSDGEKMLVSFCLRLALLHNMYKESTVFAVLDDPFVSLDDENLPKVLDALKNLSGSTQLLYLTCHQSRMPAE